MARTTSVTTDDDVLEDDDFLIDMSDDEEEDQDAEELDDSDDDLEEEDEDEEEEPSPKRKRGGTERQSIDQTDWESRFKGLQSSVQRKEEENKLLLQHVIMARAEAFKAQLLAQDLEPQEAERQFQAWMANQALQIQAMKNQTDQQSVEEVARAVVLQQIASDHGIDIKSKTFERLSQMRDPDSMRAFAEEISSTRKTAAKTTKKAVSKAKGSRRFDSGAARAGTAPAKKAKNLDDAAALFSKYKIEL